MNYKVVIAGDRHDRPQDISSIRGYCRGLDKVKADLYHKALSEGWTHFISLGDLYDAGYGSDVASALNHVNFDMLFNRLLKGNYYGLIGNHIRVRMDSNPELFLIQPHPTYKMSCTCTRTEQIIKTPNFLKLGNIGFYFMHYNPLARSVEDYKPKLDMSCSYHVGLFHTEMILPRDLQLNGMAAMSESRGAIEQTLRGLDLVIDGHIHKPMDPIHITHPDGTVTLLYVPGSLTNTTSSENERHDFIDMPTLIFSDVDTAPTITYTRQSLHTEELQFLSIDDRTNSTRVATTLAGNSKETLYDELVTETLELDGLDYLSVSDFMDANGYSVKDKQMVRQIIASPTNISLISEIFHGRLEI